jgi:hypothetical protein
MKKEKKKLKIMEVEQMEGTELIVRCNCGGHHFTSFRFTIDRDKMNKIIYKRFSIQLILPEASIWKRIRGCLWYLLEGTWCHDEVYFTQKDLKKIEKLIKEYYNLK